MAELIQIKAYPVKNVLSRLLSDKTTGKNIIFATDYYARYGCTDTDQITADTLLGFDSVDIQPRVKKAQAEQSERTRQKAEVFTPAWIVRQMCDNCGSINEEKNADDWQKYVQQRILEITCGEAPFLVTRYDTTTGEPLPIAERTGMLDRKLKAIQADDEETWLKWAYLAYESTYGYEFQGDSLLIARINLLVTFCDYLEERWQRKATDSELEKTADIIAWNLWQMDGLKDTVPLGVPGEEFHQLSLFEENESAPPDEDDCRIYDWQNNSSLLFRDMKEGKTDMKFDFVIGNPPYQEDTEGTSDNPVYHLFMNEAYKIADKVELITPARFLFNAGKTPKAWNEKMLADSHLKVLYYEQISSKIFKNTDIKGGIAVTYRDSTQKFGAIDTFIAIDELRSIFDKMRKFKYESFSTLIYSPESYRFTELMHRELPDVKNKLSKGHEYDLTTNIFEKLENIVFFKECPQDGQTYIRIYGKKGTERMYMWILKKYVAEHENLDCFKVILPKSNGSGAIGEVLSTPLVGTPLVGHTQTFISIGAFNSEFEAKACLNYLKTKFARTMLGILKVTQHNPSGKWKYVPLQDFTPDSDIDWSKPVPEIDRQLYAKYGLTQEETDFIETHVKEMK